MVVHMWQMEIVTVAFQEVDFLDEPQTIEKEEYLGTVPNQRRKNTEIYIKKLKQEKINWNFD